MSEFKKTRFKFALRGIQLSRPVDLLEPNKVAIANNVRSYVDGEIRQRPGLALLYDVDTGATDRVHSIKRLNDSVNSRSTYFTGAGTKLYADDSGHTVATEIDSGYSGDPLALVVHRPDASPLPFLYVADRSRMRKAKSTAAADTFKSYPIGISPPLVPPTVSLASPLVKVVDDLEATAGWTQGGDAGAPSLLAGKRVDTTITYILYDSGTTGFASVNPDALTAQLQKGMRLTVNTGGGSAETVLVEDVYPAITSTTISSIEYDSGTTGPCTIVLTAPSAALRKDSMVRLASAENVRVLSVIGGPQGVTSFKCSTVATYIATDAVDGLASFRANFTANHLAAETLTAEAVETSITYSTGIATLTKTSALDLSISSTRPINEDDYMALGVRVDRPDLVTEIKVQLDVADATNDFTKDFYTKTFRSADLTAAVRNTTPTLTVEQRTVQREQIDEQVERYRSPEMISRLLRYDETSPIGIDPFDPIPLPGPSGPSPGQLGLGDSVWSTLEFRLGDMERVGQDSSRNLKNVAAIRVVVICTGNVVLDIDSWYVRGGYGLDVTGALWAYRYRSLETKARSQLSPPTRSPLDVTRGSVTVNCTTKDTTSSGDPQVTAIDIYRFDDVLVDWYLVGTVANPSNAAATTVNFTDEYSDEYVVNNPLAEFNQFQPWPVPDQPRSGICDVKGTEVTRISGDTFNTSWGRGSRPLKINGIPCTLYTSPTSTSRLSLNENLGTLTSVTWEFDEPLLLGQPRAVLFGPYGSGSSGIFFFSVDGGTLIWTNPNNPDAASDRNRLEITSPSEPLMNGFMYDGRPYVFSTERLFAVYPNFGGSSDFVAQEIANCKGLFGKWALCVADGGLVYWLGKDGLYESEGGQSRRISDDLYPLFPHDGIAGVTTGGYLPPVMTQTALRLSHSDGRVKFTYIDSNGDYRAFVWNPTIAGFESHDLHAPNICIFYNEEGEGVHGELAGSKDGKLYQVSGTTDAGTAINSQVRTKAEDCGLFQRKLIGDVQVDTDTASQNLTLAAYSDNFATALTVSPSTLTTAARRPVIVDISSGAGVVAYNIGLDLSWTNTAIKLYEFVISFIERPDDALRRFTDYLDYGYPGDKRVTGFVVTADTFNVAKSFSVDYDGGSTVGTFSVTHNGKQSASFALTTPIIAKLLRISTTDTDQWQLYDVEFQYEKYPENVNVVSDFTDLNSLQAKRINGFIIEADTSNISRTLTVQRNGVASTVRTQAIQHNGRVAATYELDPFYANTVRLISDGALRLFKLEWLYEVVPEFSGLNPDFDDLGHKGSKRINGIVIEADSSESSAGDATFTIKRDGDDSTTVQTLASLTFAGRTEQEHELTPFVAHTVKLLPSEDVRVFGVRWLFEPLPENAAIIPDFDDLGYKGDKRINGFVIEADTANAPVTLTVQRNGSTTTVTTQPITHNGRVQQTYELTPFTAQTVRIVPSADLRFYGIRWLAEPLPELAALNPDFSDLEHKGSKRVYGIIIEADSTDSSLGNATFTIKKDGDDTTAVQTLTNLTFAGRSEQAHELTPFIASTLKLTPSEDVRVFGVRWIFDPLPELAAFSPDFDDLGFKGEKRINGFVIEADTTNSPVTLTIQKDGSTSTVTTQAITHNGRVQQVYELTPFLAQTVRIIPDADLRMYGVRWLFDPYPENAALNADFDDLQFKGDKRIYGVVIEADTTDSSAGNATFVVRRNGDDVTAVQTLSNLTFAGRTEQAHELTPFVAATVKLVPSEDARMFGVRWLYEPLPENAALVPDFSDLGFKGDKRINGFVIEADTSNAPVTLTIQRNGSTATVTTQAITHNGRIQAAYELTPFIAETVRIVPDVDLRFYGVRWLYEPLNEFAALSPDYDDLGYKGSKRINGLIIEADTANLPVTLTIQKDGSTATVSTKAITHNGRVQAAYDVTPFVAQTVRLVPDVDLRVYGVRWLFEPYPELLPLVPDFTDDGDPRAKWLQGFEIEADTDNVACTLRLDCDDTVGVQSFTITHNGRRISAFSLDTPVICHTMRLVPTSGSLRAWKVKWIWEPEPDLVEEWKTQPTTFDLPGYFSLRDGYIAHRSTADITLTVNVDGTNYVYTIPHNSGNYKKTYLPFQAVKGKSMQFSLTSTAGFRLYQRDCSINAIAWARQESYLRTQPFGDASRLLGARI